MSQINLVDKINPLPANVENMVNSK